MIPLEQLKESSFYQFIEEEGMKKGLMKGREEGREEGELKGVVCRQPFPRLRL